MNVIQIQTFDRGNGSWAAIACHEGQLLSTGAAAAAVTEEAAAAEAVLALFQRDRERESLPRGPFAPTKRAETAAGIKALLDNLIADSQEAWMQYRNEDAVTTRQIRPYSRDTKANLLLAIDVEHAEPRSFRLDRIEWVEAI